MSKQTLRTITKRELAERLAARTGGTVEEASDRIENLLEIIRDAFIAGERIELRRFGVFGVVERAAKIGQNPNNPGTPVRIPARKVVRFKPSRLVQKALGGGLGQREGD